MYTTNPIADPAASTVFAHSMFSAESDSIVGTWTMGTSFEDTVGGVLIVNVPINV